MNRPSQLPLLLPLFHVGFNVDIQLYVESVQHILSQSSHYKNSDQNDTHCRGNELVLVPVDVWHFADASANRLDGLRLDWQDSWLLVRGSNTEPIVRLIAEGPKRERSVQVCDEAASIIQKFS